MTEKQAWARIARGLEHNPHDFLCNAIKRHAVSGLITRRQEYRMLGKIKALRQYIRVRYNRPDWEVYCLWPSRSQERIKFAKLAARGHAADYKYPQALADELAAMSWGF